MGCCEISGIDKEKGLSILILSENEDLKYKKNSDSRKQNNENIESTKAAESEIKPCPKPDPEKKTSDLSWNNKIQKKISDNAIENPDQRQKFPSKACYRTSDNFSEISENIKLFKLPDCSSNSSIASWKKL